MPERSSASGVPRPDARDHALGGEAAVDEVIVVEKAVVVERTQPHPPKWLVPLRDRVHRWPGGATIWRVGIIVVGGVIVAAGLALIPLPGPGWAIVFLGLAVWATEFVWAQRLLSYGRSVLRRWTAWVLRQSLVVRGLLGLVGLAFVAAVLYFSWTLLH